MARDDWHLDKKVMISILGMLGSLFVGFVAQTIYLTNLFTEWKTTTDNRFTVLEKCDGGQASHERRLVLLEQQFGYIPADLAEINTLLKRRVPTETEQQQ